MESHVVVPVPPSAHICKPDVWAVSAWLEPVRPLILSGVLLDSVVVWVWPVAVDWFTFVWSNSRGSSGGPWGVFFEGGGIWVLRTHYSCVLLYAALQCVFFFSLYFLSGTFSLSVLPLTQKVSSHEPSPRWTVSSHTVSLTLWHPNICW